MLTSAVVVRVDGAAAARPPPPAKGPGVAAMLMGATTHGRSAAFFRNFCPRTWYVNLLRVFMLMDQTEPF